MPHIFVLTPVLALLLFVFLPWRVALPLCVPIAIGSLAIARKVMQAQREPPREDEALEILRRRYAAGEIDREEFERMREELRS